MPAPGAVAAARAAEAALLHAARAGTAEDVRVCASRVAGSSLADIDAPGLHGVTPLHAAASRGDPDVARALLDAGAAARHSLARPLRADAESGWTATHRAMYHGKWRVVQALLERGGSLDHPVDLAGRTPLDALAARLRRSRDARSPSLRARSGRRTKRARGATGDDATARPRGSRDLYSWGSGVNYQLGHGTCDDAATPRRVDCLTGVGGGVLDFDASKFHSVVALRDGSVYSWGHGRGGRLGVDDADVYDGDGAALRPTPVPFPPLRRRKSDAAGFALPARDGFPARAHFVTRVAAGKHHTLAVTSRGVVFSWGRAADGRLGYGVLPRSDAARDAAARAPEAFSNAVFESAYQRTPRAVTGALRDAFAVDVAAANRHSAVVTSSGEVFAFGSNAFGQLGRRERASAPAAPPRRSSGGSAAASTFSAFFENERGAAFGSPSSARGSPNGDACVDASSSFVAASSGGPGGPGPSRAARPASGRESSGSGEWSPASVDALKPLGRVFVAVSASKRHTVVLDATGAVYQFGQGDHSPRRVVLRDAERSDENPGPERGRRAAALPEAEASEVAAGTNLSLARARDGSVRGWFSRDPHLRSFRVCGFGTGTDTDAVSVAAGKRRCAVVTGAGDAYLFDAPEFPGDALDARDGTSRVGVPRTDTTVATVAPRFRAPEFAFQRAEGVRRVDAVRLGESHALAAQALTGSSPGVDDAAEAEGDSRGSDVDADSDSSATRDADSNAEDALSASTASSDASDDARSSEASSDASSSFSETFSFGVFGAADEETSAGFADDDARAFERRRRNARRAVPSLRQLAQASLARSSCDARSVFELLAFAESVGADALAAHCRRFASRNADAVFAERGSDALAGVPAETLRTLETWSAELDADSAARDAADAAFLAAASLVVAPRAEARRSLDGGVSRDGAAEMPEKGPNERSESLSSDAFGAEAATPPREDAALPRETRARARDATGGGPFPSWLEARTARGVARGPPKPPPTPPTTRVPRLVSVSTGTSSRSRRAAADAAASRVARGGLSLFLSGALEDAVARGGGDAAVAAAAAARDARARAPPRGWDVGRGAPSSSGSRSPGTSASPSLRDIAAAQARDAREAAARARGYAATAARRIETEGAASDPRPVARAPAFQTKTAPNPPETRRAPGGATAVSLAALAGLSRGAYGGRGEATVGVSSATASASAWSGGGSPSGTAFLRSRNEDPARVSLAEILREEEAAAEERASSSEKSAGGVFVGSRGGGGGSLGKSGWFVPDAHRGSPSSGGLAGIVRDEEAMRAAAAEAAALEAASERKMSGGKSKERPKARRPKARRPKDPPKTDPPKTGPPKTDPPKKDPPKKDPRNGSRRGKTETSAKDERARSKKTSGGSTDRFRAPRGLGTPEMPEKPPPVAPRATVAERAVERKKKKKTPPSVAPRPRSESRRKARSTPVPVTDGGVS